MGRNANGTEIRNLSISPCPLSICAASLAMLCICVAPRIEKGLLASISSVFSVLKQYVVRSPEKSLHKSWTSPVAVSSSDFRNCEGRRIPWMKQHMLCQHLKAV